SLGGILNTINPFHYFKAEINAYENGCGYLGSIKFGLEGTLVAVTDVATVAGTAARLAAKAATGAIDAGALSSEQAANLARYTRKLPSGAGEPQIVRLANGSVRFSTDVPGRVPGSYARYIKTVDETGTTSGYVKETYGPN